MNYKKIIKSKQSIKALRDKTANIIDSAEEAVKSATKKIATTVQSEEAFKKNLFKLIIDEIERDLILSEMDETRNSLFINESYITNTILGLCKKHSQDYYRYNGKEYLQSLYNLSLIYFKTEEQLLINETDDGYCIILKK